MAKNIKIIPIDPNTEHFQELAIEARAAGYKFVDRLIEDAHSGLNCFDKEGECFCGVFIDGALIGCGGVNRDPYTNRHVGRVRHVYILQNFRKNGVGKALVFELISRSKNIFKTFRLRTSDSKADAFYEAIGFARTNEPNASHIMKVV